MINNIPELEDLGDLADKNVLVRVDFNVPLSDGEISDDFRIQAALPTINYLNDAGAHLTLCTHLGRPGGKEDPRFSVEPIRDKLKSLNLGNVKLLENLRFNPGEKTNDKAFAQKLAEGQDLYVNDAFGVSHREEASSVGVTDLLPCAAGRLVINEIIQLDKLLASERKPFIAVMGGLKVSDKLEIIESLLSKVDGIIIGGAMAFTFLKSQGFATGSSIVEQSMLDTCSELLKSDTPIHLPNDFVAIEGSIDGDGPVANYSEEIPDGCMGTDIGPESAARFSELISETGTLFWNGPMGAFEDPRFEAGTAAIAEAIAESEAFSVVGGGDSAAAAKQFKITDEVDHISTGGGASLKYIETGKLVAIEAMK